MNPVRAPAHDAGSVYAPPNQAHGECKLFNAMRENAL